MWNLINPVRRTSTTKFRVNAAIMYLFSPIFLYSSFLSSALKFGSPLRAYQKGFTIPPNVVYVRKSPYTKSKRKNFLFQNPIQLLTQGQWWSIFSTHLLQVEQWWHLSGLNTLQIKQYLRLLLSLSPKWNPQNVGTCPGSLYIVLKKAHISMRNSIL